MSDEAACTLLGVDAWGLERLIAQGELVRDEADVLSEDALNTYKVQRDARRADAIALLALMDGPHMGNAQ